jgi:hypothetical protein
VRRYSASGRILPLCRILNSRKLRVLSSALQKPQGWRLRKKRKSRHTKFQHSIMHVTLVEVLIEHREKAGMKQVHVSAGMGRPAAYCNRVEHLERVPNPMELMIYCHAIKTKLSIVMTEVEQRLVAKGVPMEKILKGVLLEASRISKTAL